MPACANTRVSEAISAATAPLYGKPDLVDPDQENLHRRVERLRSWSYSAETLPASTVNEKLEPGAALPEIRIAHFPEETWVDVPTLTRTLVEAAGSNGVSTLVGNAVCGIEAGGEGVKLDWKTRPHDSGRRRGQRNRCGGGVCGGDGWESCRWTCSGVAVRVAVNARLCVACTRRVSTCVLTIPVTYCFIMIS